jgi:hypothetical protein
LGERQKQVSRPIHLAWIGIWMEKVMVLQRVWHCSVNNGVGIVPIACRKMLLGLNITSLTLAIDWSDWKDSVPMEPCKNGPGEAVKPW